MSADTRETVVDALTFTDDTQKSDLLDETLTNTNLIAMLEVLVIDRGHKLTVTSVRSDHGDDSGLGPHGHSGGFAVDVVPDDDADAQAILEDAVDHDSYCTKVGLGGRYQAYNDALSPLANASGTIVFNDNSQDHIHLQTA